MKNLSAVPGFPILFMAVTMTISCGQSKNAHEPSIPYDAQIEKKIERTMSRMSLDDKIGQMLQLNLDVFGSTAYGGNGPSWQFNETTLDTILSKYRVGSILNTPGGRAATVEDWQRIIGKIQQKSMDYLGIPCLYGLDHNHGVTYVQAGTIFPQPINLGASFNTQLATDMAQVTSYESRASDCPWVFNPVLDLGRDPRWSRIWESFGEDAIVNARMAEAEVAGYQGDDANHLGAYNVAACIKHYFCYGAPFSGKDRTPAYVSPAMPRASRFFSFFSEWAHKKAGIISIF